MTPNQSIASLVDRVSRQRAAGASEPLGAREIGEVLRLSRAVSRCPSCSASVTRHAHSCRSCGELLLRTSA